MIFSSPPVAAAIVSFPEPVVAFLIYGSLILTGLGAILLIALIIRDWKKGELW